MLLARVSEALYCPRHSRRILGQEAGGQSTEGQGEVDASQTTWLAGPYRLGVRARRGPFSGHTPNHEDFGEGSAAIVARATARAKRGGTAFPAWMKDGPRPPKNT